MKETSSRLHAKAQPGRVAIMRKLSFFINVPFLLGHWDGEDKKRRKTTVAEGFQAVPVGAGFNWDGYWDIGTVEQTSNVE